MEIDPGRKGGTGKNAHPRRALMEQDQYLIKGMGGVRQRDWHGLRKREAKGVRELRKLRLLQGSNLRYVSQEEREGSGQTGKNKKMGGRALRLLFRSGIRNEESNGGKDGMKRVTEERKTGW